MLHLFRRHRRACASFGTRSQDRNSKPKCPIHFERVDGTGRRLEPQSLEDLASGSGIRGWNRAVEVIRDVGIPNQPEQTQKPAVGISEPIDSFLAYKAGRSPDVQLKARLVLRRLKSFAGLRGKLTIEEITFVDLVDFRAAWTEARRTQRRDQEVLKGFFRFCVKSDFVVGSPASNLGAISEGRPKTDPLTREEMERIFAAVDKLPDEYGRRGQPIAGQTRAFVLVMRCSGVSIGDTAKLLKAAVQGDHIRTHRKKTEEDFFGKVPPFVMDALNNAPHGGGGYYFWTGSGLLHACASKWGGRLQRLFVAANVRAEETVRKIRLGGKLKDEPQTVKISKATPHMLRHALARVPLGRGTPMEEIPELLGNSMRVVGGYYGKSDARRQARLERRLVDFWEDNPLTKC